MEHVPYMVLSFGNASSLGSDQEFSIVISYIFGHRLGQVICADLRTCMCGDPRFRAARKASKGSSGMIRRSVGLGMSTNCGEVMSQRTQ